MDWHIEKKISLGSLMTLVTVIVAVISVFVYMQSDVEKVKEQQEIHEQFRRDVRQNYINRDQLEYRVIERLDRLENNIDNRLERIEKAVSR